MSRYYTDSLREDPAKEEERKTLLSSSTVINGSTGKQQQSESVSRLNCCRALLSHQALCFYLVTLFLLPLGAVLPSLNEFCLARVCVEMYGNATHCDAPEVSGAAANWANYIMLACNIPNVLTGLALGSLSDRFGRRPLLLFNLITQCSGSIGMVATMLFNLPLWAMMPTFILNGIGGGSYAFIALIMASLVDGCAGKDNGEQTRVFRTLMLVTYACGALGPLIGGQLSRYVPQITPSGCSWCHGGDQQANFVLFLATNILLVLLAACCFRETVPHHVMEKARQTMRGQSWGHAILEPTFGPLRILKRAPALSVLCTVYGLLYVGFADRNSLLNFYAKKTPFSMSDDLVGWFLFAPWLVRGVTVLLLLPAILYVCERFYYRHYVRKYHRSLLLADDSASDAAAAGDIAKTLASRYALLTAVRCGAFFAVTVTACYGLAKTVPTLFALVCVEAIDALWDTSCRVLFVQLGSDVGANAGAVTGVIGFLQVLLGVVAPASYQPIYAATVVWSPCFVFYLIAGVSGAGLLATFFLNISPTPPPPPPPSSSSRFRNVVSNENDHRAGGSG